MVQELERLGDLVKWSDEVEDGGNDVGQAQADASNVNCPEAPRHIYVAISRFECTCVLVGVGSV